jgi:carboxypeptidase family protein
MIFVKRLSRIAAMVLLLFLTFNSAKAQQTGEISGRVITEDGTGMPNLYVTIFPINSTQGPSPINRSNRVTTDDNGNFRVTGLAPRIYQVNVFQTKGYTVQPPPSSEGRERRYYRIGETATITMIKGGVITGKVTTADGEPLVGVYVGATLVRDAEGIKGRELYGARQRQTDDRGIYRLFGLAPGTYIVSTRGNGYEGNTPTYYPSSARETADEVMVMSGGEATGVDIRMRDVRGHTISGTVTGGGEPASPYIYASVTLTNAATGAHVLGTAARSGEGGSGFALPGVDDGEYEIVGNRSGGELLSSLPRRVTVKGADVSGIDLKLIPMASISGRVVIEKSQNACQEPRKNLMEEILITARRDLTGQGREQTNRTFTSDTGVNQQGDFTAKNLQPSRYRFEVYFPGETLFLKSISTNSAATARAGIAVKAGEKLNGVIVTIAEGAASLSGRIIAQAEEAQLPSRLRVHLVPAETTAADEVSRYRETLAGGDRTFTFNNLSPGRYWLLTRALATEDVIDREALPLAWENTERAKLRREAEAKKVEVDLKPCQRVANYNLKY